MAARIDEQYGTPQSEATQEKQCARASAWISKGRDFPNYTSNHFDTQTEEFVEMEWAVISTSNGTNSCS